MKLRGGYNVRLAGEPAGEIETLPEPGVLHMPLWSRRFRFTQLVVSDGQRVRTGQPLAKAPASHSLQLLAPRSGTVRLEAVADHITLEDLEKEPEEAHGAGRSAGKTSEGMTRYKLFALGAWRFARDAHTCALPDPFGMPKAVIVSTVSLEPYVARADAQLRGRLSHFGRGLEHLKSLLRTPQMYVVVPRTRSAFAAELREMLREHPCGTVVEVPPRYPYGDLRLLARALRLKRQWDAPVWGFAAAGVLAIDDAITFSRPCVTSVISIGGPSAVDPRHAAAVPGYPLEDIIARHARGAEPRESGPDVPTPRPPCRVVNGGVLTGSALAPEQAGLDVECEGLTLLPEHARREFLGFMRPGFFRGSYSRCFLSSLRPAFPERYTTGVRGERRPCVSCGFCEEACPAGIMPHLIHKYLYKNDIDGAEKARIDLCIECGLCTFVCPAKIELRRQFIEAKETIRQELHAEEVTA